MANAIPNLSRKILAVVKTEATYGSTAFGASGAAAATADLQGVSSSAMLLYEEMNPISIDTTVVELSPLRASYSKFQDLIGRQLFGVMLKAELTNAFGSGSTGASATHARTNHPPFIAPLLKACALQETASSSGSGSIYGSVTYKPRSSGFQSCQARIWLDSAMHDIMGMYGTCVFEASAGAGFSVSFDMKGRYLAPVQQTIPTTVTYPEDKRVLVATEALTITPAGGSPYEPIVRSFKLDIGNNLIERSDMNTARGFFGMFIADRKPTLEMTVEMDLLTNFNPLEHISSSAGVSTTHKIKFLHNSQPNSIAFLIPKAQLTNVQYQDDSGIRTYQLSYNIVSDADDDDFTITFCGGLPA